MKVYEEWDVKIILLTLVLVGASCAGRFTQEEKPQILDA
jgi:hypothetical protein